MKSALIEQEEMRLALLRGYNILDTAPEEDFDEIVQLTAEICGTPLAMISLVEEDRQWFKSAHGTTVLETPIDMSMCAHAVKSREYMEIGDTTADPRTAKNDMVTGDENVRFYAGALLEGEDGLSIGTLCVLDRTPRQLNDFQRRALKVLAKQVMRQIEMRQALGAAELLRKEVDHRVKNSLQSLEALIRIQARGETSDDAKRALDSVQSRLATISKLHEALYLTETGAAVDVSAFVRRVLETAAIQMPAGVEITTDVTRADLDSRAASSVGMVVNEAMMNAAKYAFEGRKTGAFHVAGTHADGTYTLICRDDGDGPKTTGAEGTGMGQRIMQAAAQQLGGEIETEQGETGYNVTLRWPLA